LVRYLTIKEDQPERHYMALTRVEKIWVSCNNTVFEHSARRIPVFGWLIPSTGVKQWSLDKKMHIKQHTRRTLVINVGSSSIKYRVFCMGSSDTVARGLLERIGTEEAVLTHSPNDAAQESEKKITRLPGISHADGLHAIVQVLRADGVLDGGDGLAGIGHRVVHGGDRYAEPTLITPQVIESIRHFGRLAPLHNPVNLCGIETAQALFPDVPQVAVFDTAFHQTMPAHAYRYALPEDCYRDHHVRRYGFHGTSHQYVAGQVAEYLGKSPDVLNLIILHLGNGASLSAVRGGCCIDTSMGMTPLEGLMMGSRCGDLDPAVPLYLARAMDLTNSDVDKLLNEQSGLRGVCGVSDMRQVHRMASGGSDSARLALDMYCYRVKKYIGAYYAVLGRVDALVFTAGIGEHDADVRKRCCEGLDALGIVLDSDKNNAASETVSEIHHARAEVKALVVPTNEEWEIACQTLACINIDSA
jgi:acetate kinase